MLNFTNRVLAHTIENGEVDLQTEHHGFGMMGNLDWGWSGMFFGWLIMILFWAVIVLSIVALVKYISNGRYENRGNDKRVKDNSYDSLGKKIYVCPECGYEYKEKDWATKCQKWCSLHKSCNIDIIKHGESPKNS